LSRNGDTVVDAEALIEFVRRASPNARGRCHGEVHWFGVAKTGLQLLRSGTGADPAVVFCFALLHDVLDGYCRTTHGQLAAQVALRMSEPGEYNYLRFDQRRNDLLCQALVAHSLGRVSDDPTIGTCWDADRLQLVRFGRTVDPALLSTATAKLIAKQGVEVPSTVTWRGLIAEYDTSTPGNPGHFNEP
jgi:uncharacterized protein